MDKEIIKEAKRQLSRNIAQDSPAKLQASTPDIVRKTLAGMTPAEFLKKHNPALAAVILRRGTACGELALNEAIPTLGHLAATYGEALPVAWLKVLLLDVENVLGVTAYPEAAVAETARQIYANYTAWNVGNILQFFGRYKAGEWAERLQHIPGMQRIMSALKIYGAIREDDVRRILREREREAACSQREEWRRKAVTHEEAVGTPEYKQGYKDAVK